MSFLATGDLKSLTAAEAQLVEASLIEQAEKNDDHIEAMLLAAFEEVSTILMVEGRLRFDSRS